MRFLYAYFQAIVQQHTEQEVLRVQNLHALQVPCALEINLRIVRIHNFAQESPIEKIKAPF